jgi:hypothetical protein
MLLGGLFGAMINGGLIEHKSRRVIAARKNLIEHVDASQRDAMITAFQTGLEQVTDAGAKRLRLCVISAVKMIISPVCHASGIRRACSSATATKIA